MLDAARHLSQLRHEGDRLLGVAAGALDVDVPTCPGWTMADLVAHVARVHQFLAAQVRARATGPVSRDDLPEPPPDADVVEVGRRALGDLVAVLADADPDEPLWTWGPPETVAFYARRAGHETTIHRLDAEAALGETTPLDPELAVDAVDEFFETVVPFNRQRRALPLPEGSLHLHRTDGDGEWLVTTAGDRIRVTREHARGDAAVRGPVADLLCVLWGRRGRDTVEIFGDPGIVDAWTALAP